MCPVRNVSIARMPIYDYEQGHYIDCFVWSFALRRLFLFKIIYCEFVSESQNNPKAAFYQQATNGAGLSSVASSRSYTVDASPPVNGRVSEITSGSLDDIDFQVLITT